MVKSMNKKEKKIIIETSRLILREYTLDDFDELYKMLSDPITMKHYLKPYDEEGARRWISWSLDNYKKYGFGLWAIELKETGQFIGDCGITIQNIDGELLPDGRFQENPSRRQRLPFLWVFLRCGMYAKGSLFLRTSKKY